MVAEKRTDSAFWPKSRSFSSSLLSISSPSSRESIRLIRESDFFCGFLVEGERDGFEGGVVELFFCFAFLDFGDFSLTSKSAPSSSSSLEMARIEGTGSFLIGRGYTGTNQKIFLGTEGGGKRKGRRKVSSIEKGALAPQSIKVITRIQKRISHNECRKIREERRRKGEVEDEVHRYWPLFWRSSSTASSLAE